MNNKEGTVWGWSDPKDGDDDDDDEDCVKNLLIMI